MKKFEITINASFTVEAEDEEEAKQEVLINYMLDKHDLEVDEVEEDEWARLRKARGWSHCYLQR